MAAQLVLSTVVLQMTVDRRILGTLQQHVTKTNQHGRCKHTSNTLAVGHRTLESSSGNLGVI